MDKTIQHKFTIIYVNYNRFKMKFQYIFQKNSILNEKFIFKIRRAVYFKINGSKAKILIIFKNRGFYLKLLYKFY